MTYEITELCSRIQTGGDMLTTSEFSTDNVLFDMSLLHHHLVDNSIVRYIAANKAKKSLRESLRI